MQYLIDFLSKYKTGQQGDDSEFSLKLDYTWESKARLAQYTKNQYAEHLKAVGRFDGEFNYNDKNIIPIYKDLLDRQYIAPHPIDTYHRLCALEYFYDVLIYEIPSISIYAMFRLDFHLIDCVAIANETVSFKQGAISKAESDKKKRQKGMDKKAVEREKQVVDAIDKIIPAQSLTNLRDKIYEYLHAEYKKAVDNGQKPLPLKPFGRDRILSTLKKNEKTALLKVNF